MTPREESPAVIHCTRIRCRAPLRVSKGPCSPEDFRHTNPSPLSHLGHSAGQTLVAALEQIAWCRGLYSPESAASALGRLHVGQVQCYPQKNGGATVDAPEVQVQQTCCLANGDQSERGQ